MDKYIAVLSRSCLLQKQIRLCCWLRLIYECFSFNSIAPAAEEGLKCNHCKRLYPIKKDWKLKPLNCKRRITYVLCSLTKDRKQSVIIWKHVFSYTTPIVGRLFIYINNSCIFIWYLTLSLKIYCFFVLYIL